ncbi:hypothetical protein [Nostoc sp. CENA543]|nr:hypothetical protein [Nostoc sp. CENA543]
MPTLENQPYATPATTRNSYSSGLIMLTTSSLPSNQAEGKSNIENL